MYCFKLLNFAVILHVAIGNGSRYVLRCVPKSRLLVCEVPLEANYSNVEKTIRTVVASGEQRQD